MVEKSSGIFNIVYSVGTNKCSNRISYLSDDNFGSGDRKNAFISDCCWNNFIIEFSNILCYIKVKGSCLCSFISYDFYNSHSNLSTSLYC